MNTSEPGCIISPCILDIAAAISYFAISCWEILILYFGLMNVDCKPKCHQPEVKEESHFSPKACD